MTAKGGKSPRQKGDRRERELVQLLADYGAERVPLSGAAGGSFAGDVVLHKLGLTVQCKAEANGFKRLYSWLFPEEGPPPDMLALRSDRKKWLVVLPLSVFKKLVGRSD